ncbi:putative tRNA pseudouridine synthase Pus10-like isoform X2 [Hibiscus syriacus]|uniref:tRNA pseudouridine(55) synthase n=1 Tax=Hibiscus syriacus TaxID=106335 RepID=A0A6A3BL90_HIBSY|nr:putative tRNA pseudouridine synthase Pus10-like isoform X2 [Hibiscus syriacus]
MGEASVEEIIGSNILPMCRGDNYKFHAAGREDIDVRMLGSGKPFLLEIQNARQVPSEETIKEIESKINGLENKLVGVKNLKVVGSQGWTLMRDGEAEKQKQYCALVWISRPLEDEDVQSISLLNEMQILQKTPIRVLHHRSPLERQKIIHWMKIERISGSPQYFLLHLSTQSAVDNSRNLILTTLFHVAFFCNIFLLDKDLGHDMLSCKWCLNKCWSDLVRRGSSVVSRWLLLVYGAFLFGKVQHTDIFGKQAGNYIKEFVHGDLWRTQPIIGSILGCRAEITQLDVTDVKMDSF